MERVTSIIFLRNRGSEKERVAEEMSIGEVRLCSRLLTPVDSLIRPIAPLCGEYMLVYNIILMWLFLSYVFDWETRFGGWLKILVHNIHIFLM